MFFRNVGRPPTEVLQKYSDGSNSRWLTAEECGWSLRRDGRRKEVSLNSALLEGMDGSWTASMEDDSWQVRAEFCCSGNRVKGLSVPPTATDMKTVTTRPSIATVPVAEGDGETSEYLGAQTRRSGPPRWRVSTRLSALFRRKAREEVRPTP